MLDKFAPKEVVHLGDTIMAALLSLFLLTNAARMFVGLTRDDNIPASALSGADRLADSSGRHADAVEELQ